MGSVGVAGYLRNTRTYEAPQRVYVRLTYEAKLALKEQIRATARIGDEQRLVSLLTFDIVPFVLGLTILVDC